MDESWKKKSILTLKVKTNAQLTQITEYNIENNILKIDVKGAREKGKANKEIISFLSKLLRKNIKIISGKTSKIKIIKIE